MKRVIIESPFAGRCAPGWPWPISAILKWIDRLRNIRYLRACLRDSLMRMEAPYASHAIYTLPGVLRDYIPEERDLGITAGFRWGDIASKRVFYVDRGWSRGMKLGLDRARLIGQKIEERSLASYRKKPRLPHLADVVPLKKDGEP
jgi:hypothetical protein